MFNLKEILKESKKEKHSPLIITGDRRLVMLYQTSEPNHQCNKRHRHNLFVLCKFQVVIPFMICSSLGSWTRGTITDPMIHDLSKRITTYYISLYPPPHEKQKEYSNIQRKLLKE